MTAAPLDDREFVEAFESGALSAGAFHHRDHVRLAWLYLRRLPPASALAKFSDGLRRFAASAGKAGLYHETITCAYLLLIRERMERGGRAESWSEFAAANADLMTWKPSILDRYYLEGTLASDLARRVFVLPDRVSPPPFRAAGEAPPPRR